MTYRERARAVAWGVFIVFFAYFWATSNRLPPGAGPDQAASNAAAAFVYHHSRLAQVPRDEAALMFTAYGSTRTLRPPLSFLLGAGIAKLWQPPEERLEITTSHLIAFGGYEPVYDAYLQPAFRKGSALLCAMAVGIAFYAIAMHFGSIALALSAAVLMGTMPQFAFIASYTNDDSSAIFSATLLVAVLLAIYRNGLDLRHAVLFGLAGGLVLISKPTAWLLAPTVLLFVVAFVRMPLRRLARLAAAALIAGMVAGGWWSTFNVYHYGAEDPFARKVQERVGAEHRTIPVGATQGYAARGIGAGDLLLRDADSFWSKTIRTTIGKLDWVRLDVGPLHYGFYLAVFGIGFAYAAGRLLAYPLWAARRPRSAAALTGGRHLALEALLLFAVVFQFAVYVLRNLNTEVQLQGKYLLPVLLPVLFLFCAALNAAGQRVVAGLRSRGTAFFAVRPGTAAVATLALVSALALALHAYSLVRYVVPYYWPLTYEIGISPLEPLPLDRAQIEILRDIDRVEVNGTELRIQSTGNDPAFRVAPIHCDFPANLVLSLIIESDRGGVFQIFLDRGYGFREQDSYAVKYQKGRSHLLMPVDARNCRQVRIDPAIAPGWVTISDMAVVRLVVRQPLGESRP